MLCGKIITVSTFDGELLAYISSKDIIAKNEVQAIVSDVDPNFIETDGGKILVSR